MTRVLLMLPLLVLLASCGERAAEGSAEPVSRWVEEVAFSSEPMRLSLPNQPGSTRFAVIGDAGRGNDAQRDVGRLLSSFRDAFRFDDVLMAGDNIYGGPATAEALEERFTVPYRALLDEGVRFHAVLGNHDDPRQVAFEPLGMNGHRFYRFHIDGGVSAPGVDVFAIDSTSLDPGQLAWVERELRESGATWKVALQHHPLYSPGDYRQVSRLHRLVLEPIYRAQGVDAVFSGHEHFYARMRPQLGILYVISGAGGALRRGAARPAPFVARSYDEDCHFVLVEITGEGLYFQAVSRTGETVDAGVLRKLTLTRSAGMPGPR